MRNRTFATILIGLAIPTLYAAQANADGLRCGSRLVLTGDTRASVRNKCGDPADVTHSTRVKRPSFVFHGRLYHGEEAVVDVENWIYNFGPNRFMQRVRFVDGIVEDVESLDYGYHEK